MQCLGNQVGEDVYQGAVGTQKLCEYVLDDKQLLVGVKNGEGKKKQDAAAF